MKNTLELVKKGFSVFPLSPLSKIPLKNTNGSKDATTDINKIKEWQGLNPGCNWGIATKGNLFVIDVDLHTPELNGFESIAMLMNEYEELPETFTVHTANGGVHFYYYSDEPLGQNINFMSGIDIKAHDNNYVVAPGSIIRDKEGNKKAYEVVNDIEIADAPGWLVNLLKASQNKATSNKQVTGTTKRYKSDFTYLLELLVDGVVEGGRNDCIAHTTGKLLAYGVEPSKAFELIKFMNNNFDKPLSINEMERTFFSILEKEIACL